MGEAFREEAHRYNILNRFVVRGVFRFVGEFREGSVFRLTEDYRTYNIAPGGMTQYYWRMRRLLVAPEAVRKSGGGADRPGETTTY